MNTIVWKYLNVWGIAPGLLWLCHKSWCSLPLQLIQSTPSPNQQVNCFSVHASSTHGEAISAIKANGFSGADRIRSTARVTVSCEVPFFDPFCCSGKQSENSPPHIPWSSCSLFNEPLLLSSQHRWTESEQVAPQAWPWTLAHAAHWLEACIWATLQDSEQVVNKQRQQDSAKARGQL